MTVVERILMLMKTQMISAYKLERELGLANASIQNWKTGKSKPSVDALIKIADYFNVSIDYLVGREINNNTPDLFDKLSKGFDPSCLQRLLDLPKEERKVLYDTIDTMLKNFEKSHNSTKSDNKKSDE